MMKLTELEELVKKYASKINAPKNKLPTFGYSDDMARPHIEIDNKSNFHYIIVERGQELERKQYKSLDELLFQIFRSITSTMAGEYELENRIKGQDFRRLMFKKREDLMIKLDPLWEKKIKEDHMEILSLHPFNDE